METFIEVMSISASKEFDLMSNPYFKDWVCGYIRKKLELKH
jgi:hypothetical protein